MYTPQEHAGHFKALEQSGKDNLNVSKIVTVIDIDSENNLVHVQPAVLKGFMTPDREREYQQTVPIYEVPVFTGSCGGISIKPSIEIGCIGSIVHYDHDIDNIIETGSIGLPPNTDNRHSLSDCFFLPGLSGIGGEFNTDGCYEIVSEKVTLRICPNGFDVIVNGDSLIDTLVSTGALPATWGL